MGVDMDVDIHVDMDIDMCIDIDVFPFEGLPYQGDMGSYKSWYSESRLGFDAVQGISYAGRPFHSSEVCPMGPCFVYAI